MLLPLFLLRFGLPRVRSALLSSGRIGPLLAIVLSNSYPIPACPAAHAVPALVLDVALSEVAEDRDRRYRNVASGTSSPGC